MPAADHSALRSTDPGDYQDLPRPMTAMAKAFPDGYEVEPHAHPRDQLLYSVTGIMRLKTDREAWLVPADRAAYIPAGTVHAVSISGQVEMRTLFIVAGNWSGLPKTLTVLDVSDLLRSLVLALVDEPLLYDEQGRGGAIARLIHSEIERAQALSLFLPMPRDPRLQRLCSQLLTDPSNRLSLDGWAERAGASARTLARLFERDLGMSFANWRQRVRLHGAIEALAEGQPVARVAHDHGYRSSSAFAAAFKRTFGVSPSLLKAGGGLPTDLNRRI